MHKPEASGRLLKWTIELSQFDIEYKPRGAIKGQALADFILEFPFQSEYEALIIGLNYEEWVIKVRHHMKIHCVILYNRVASEP